MARKIDGLICDNFAGGGGASTGIEAALGRAVDLAINHDEEAIRMHEANHPATMHIRNNIWQVDPVEAVREVVGRLRVTDPGRVIPVNPLTRLPLVSLAWFSPDCKHFSKAKGGKPREKSIRDLAWVVVLWAERVRPDVILLENVEEFQTWGPLCDQGFPIKDRAGETFRKWCAQLRKLGYKVEFKEMRACDYGAPTIRKRFFMVARCDGKPIVWPEPTHGKPSSPEVLAAKRLPWRTAAEIIDWSIPCPSIFERKKPLAEKTLRRIAHGIMKFVVNNPTPFIAPGAAPFFARTAHGDVDKKGKRRGQPCHGPEEPFPTVTQSSDSALIVPHITKFRSGAIGHGVDEPMHTVTANSYVKRPGGAAPLGVVEATVRRAYFHCAACGEENGGTRWPTCEWCGHEHGTTAAFVSYAQQGGANRSAEDPHHTICANNKDQNQVVTAFLTAYYGEKQDGKVRSANPADEPLRAQTTENRFGVVVAHIEQANGGPNNDNLAGRPADAPLSTVATAGSQQRLVTSNLIKLRGTSDAHIASSASAVNEPIDTISAQGTHMGEVRAFLIKYYGNEQDGHILDNPLGSVTVQDRFGLVTVTIAGEEYVIIDIGMRMLTPRELFNAQGLPPTYQIETDAHGIPITKTAQVAKCGNSVCPDMAEALAGAQFPEAVALGEGRAAA